MNQITVSAIIPVYNSADTIIDCISSIVDQTVPVNQIIVIDDGSTDNSVELIIELKEKKNLSNLILIKQENAGPSKARNVGVLVASGTYIAFLDSDDIWLPEKNEIQLNVFNEFNQGVLIGASKYEGKSKNTVELISFTKLVFKNRFMTSGVIVKRNILVKYLFDENKKYSEDYKLWLQIAYANQVYLCKQGLVKYRDSLNTKNAKSLSTNLISMEKGELDNYKFLFDNKMISFGTYCSAVLFSCFKFASRLLKRCLK